MAEAEFPAKEEPAPPPARRRRWLRPVLLVLGPAVVLLGGIYVYATGGRFVSTENAYVKANKVQISAQISGPIVSVEVAENQHVAKDAVLFRVDPVPFQVALARATAQLDKVRSEVEALKATYRAKDAEVKLAQVNTGYAEREYRRWADLANREVASRMKYDEAKHNTDVARQQASMLTQDLARILAGLDGDPDIAIERHHAYLETKAERDRVALDIANTVVKAPFAGIASKTPERGQFVYAGGPAMSLVADRNVWIEANFKETELTHVRAGQPVVVTVETYPGRSWQGVVESIAQATGAEFAVLPPQNATGNWVKIVQRIPVRVAIRAQAEDPPLRAGMSTGVEIDTGYRRPMPEFLRSAAAWLDGRSAVPSAAAHGR